MDKEKYHSKVDENIAKHGYNVTYVFGDDHLPSFCYSTGIYASFKLPEVIISGLPNNLSSDLINDYVKKFKNKVVPINYKINSLTEYFEFPIIFIEVENEALSEYVLSSIRFYGDKEFKYLQLIFPDIDGLFPNEKNYDYNQKIFGDLNNCV